jgi:Leucine-rich repeat (LRR) protein
MTNLALGAPFLFLYGGYYSGLMDEVRIWNIARTQGEIQTDMHFSGCGDVVGLLAYYPFNQGIAGGVNTGITTLNDVTPNTNNGTLINFTLSGSTSNWIKGVPGLNDCSQKILDSLALVSLYKSTNGTTWFHHTNWLTKNRVSTWYGVTVTNARVSVLDLDSNNLTGSLPSSIGNLLNLKKLSLIGNHLSGAIPSSLGNLVNLTFLDFGINQFTGTIPSSIGKLVKLTLLDLGANQLTGTIPSSFANLINLDSLYLPFNQLSGHIPSFIGNLVKLTDLNLRHNQFTGSLPSSIGNLVKLQRLRLEFNQLSGSIPVTFGNLVNLHELNLSSNQLKGTIPSSLSKLHHFNDIGGVLNLSRNGFTFDGMQLIVKTFPNAVYAPQKLILIHKKGNALSVYAGGTLSNNTYKWFRNGTLIVTIKGDSVFHPAQNGNYFAKVTNSICTKLILGTDTIFYSAPFAVTIDNIIVEQQKGTIVYPNPAKDILNVETNGSATFSLINQSGKILLTTNINGKGIINISGIAAGLYYLKINSNGNVQKVIIAR